MPIERMVSEQTACQRLVGRLVRYGEPEGVCSRLGTGMLLLRRAHEASLSGEATRELSVDGIKKQLVAHGQEGQFYRHLNFHIGCRFGSNSVFHRGNAGFQLIGVEQDHGKRHKDPGDYKSADVAAEAAHGQGLIRAKGDDVKAKQNQQQ
jgi:hypothetical protein